MKINTFLFVILISFISTRAQTSYKIRCEADSLLAPFYHGIASGEPTANGFILWTRITTDTSDTPLVNWCVATDTLFTDIAAAGSSITNIDSDFCIHVSVSGLSPATTYYYQFTYGGYHSLTGRTKTLPVGDIDSLRFAVVSCASLNAGYFNVYDIITHRNDFDAVLFLGDYIYEYESDGYGYNEAIDRPYDPEEEIIDLSDYQTRHSQYKLDEQLRILHQNFPFICAWDDHEFADNAYKDGAVNHQPLWEGDWHERVAAAEEAYFNWMPVRKQGDSVPYKTYRSFSFGNLLQLFMLDTRMDDRDEQQSYFDEDWNDTSRHIISAVQREWLFDGLKTNTAQWNVIGQQVMMSPLLALGIPINDDQWDGYPQDQELMLQFLRDSIPYNKVVLTGDIHSSWANDIATPAYSAGDHSGSAGVEFVGPSVTSPSAELGWAEDAIQLMNTHIKFIDIEHRGFMLLDINKTRTQCDYYFINNINSIDTNYNYDDSWQVLDGNNFLYHAPEASVRPSYEKVPLAPPCPMAPDTATVNIPQTAIVILGIYPNPVEDILTIQYSLFDAATIQIAISTVDGKIILHKNETQSAGLHLEKFDLSSFASGNYLMQLKTVKGDVVREIVKQ